MRVKFPLRITLLLILVAFITTWHAIRFATSIAWRDTLETYARSPGPIYIGSMGAIWMLTGLFLLWSFSRRSNWTRKALLVSSGLYAIWVWTDRLIIRGMIGANLPFDILVTFLLLSFTASVVLDPRNRSYFEREAYERESKNPPSA